MTRIFIILLCLLFIPPLCSEPRAEVAEHDYTATSSILFPDTLSWTPVNKMRKADRAYLEKNEAQLRKAFSWSKIGKERESPDCMFLDREMFSNQLYSDSFYLHDIDADGLLDVMYAGHARCAEGNSTLIWFGDKNGFVVKEQNLFDNILALSIKEGTPVLLSSLEVGCCADEIDRYHVGTIDAPRKQNISVIKTTWLPAKSEKPTPFVSNKREMVLRSSPVIDDKYNENASGLNNVAVFGNILTKYLPGRGGEVMGRHRDNDSKLWYFVVINEGCKSLRTHFPYDVGAGWVESTGIDLK